MALTERKFRPSPGYEKRGGYPGGKPASKMGPPKPVPSALIRPGKDQKPAAKPTSKQD